MSERDDGDRRDRPTGRAPGSEQRAAVVTALAANLAVALAKFGASAITGSSAMLAESLHSLADSVNEILLLVGARRSRRPADVRHPFGHARYRYVYAYVVSLTVFWLGGVLAVVEGISHLAAHEALVDPRWAFAVLGVSAALDGWSLRTTVRAGRPTKGALSWRRLLQVTKAPEIIVVFLEDLGALIGIGIALVGITLTTITGDGTWDAVASIAIGALLMTIGLLVNRETQSLLVGESASVEVVAAIREAIASTDGIEAVVDLRTIHVGPDDLVVAASVSIDPSQNAPGIARSIAEAEARVRPRGAISDRDVPGAARPRARARSGVSGINRWHRADGLKSGERPARGSEATASGRRSKISRWPRNRTSPRSCSAR